MEGADTSIVRSVINCSGLPCTSATLDLLGDVGGDVGRPLLRHVEGNYQNWGVELAGHEIREDGFKIGLSDVGLAPDTTTVSEIVGDQIEGLTNAPALSMESALDAYAPPAMTEPGAN
jgi:hypothetical protein